MDGGLPPMAKEIFNRRATKCMLKHKKLKERKEPDSVRAQHMVYLAFIRSCFEDTLLS